MTRKMENSPLTRRQQNLGNLLFPHHTEMVAKAKISALDTAGHHVPSRIQTPMLGPLSSCPASLQGGL